MVELLEIIKVNHSIIHNFQEPTLTENQPKRITHKNASRYRSEIHTNATDTSICGFTANTKII